MKKEQMKKILKQLKRYSIVETFDSVEEFNNWLNHLTVKQINSLNGLSIDSSEILFPKKILINKDLLNCDDYNNRIKALSKIKIRDGFWYFFKNLCNPHFLNRSSFYSDVDTLSKSDNDYGVKSVMWAIEHDDFLNSKYYEEDFQRILESKNNDNYLSHVAVCKDSINSPYHQKDMELIEKVNQDCFSVYGCVGVEGLDALATNKVSLKDKYHLENMKIISEHPQYKDYLYKIMTDNYYIKGKYYRDEVNALVNAKSDVKALAIYAYITNYQKDYDYEYYDLLSSLKLEYEFNYSNLIFELNRKKSIIGRKTKNYLSNLDLLNNIDDKYVLFIESLLSNKYLMESIYYEDDIKLLLNTSDVNVFSSLYKLMKNKKFLNNPYHLEDLSLISNTTDRFTRNMLCRMASDEDSINSPHHSSDMNIVSNMKLKDSDIDINIVESYVLTEVGLNHPLHNERLESLARGEKVSNANNDNYELLGYISKLENNPDIYIEDKPKRLSKIRKIFKKK